MAVSSGVVVNLRGRSHMRSQGSQISAAALDESLRADMKVLTLSTGELSSRLWAEVVSAY